MLAEPAAALVVDAEPGSGQLLGTTTGRGGQLMADVSSVVSGARQAIGAYFSLVSVLPSLLFVAYLYSLVESGAWWGTPDPHRAIAGLGDLGLDGLAILLLVSFGLGVVIHPMQFALVQMLEGYWGSGRTAQAVRVTLMRRHHRRFAALSRHLLDDAWREEADVRQPGVWEDLSRGDEAERLLTYYPDDPQLIMPTRLGNVLRRYESAAGRPFGMAGMDALPYVALVATDKHVDYLNDQRSGLDLAVRVSLTSALACLATVLFLWDDGLWLLLALLPYAGTYLSYRGAVITASHYGTAICAILALNRFELYERLHVPMPGSINREVALNKTLRDLLRGIEPDGSTRLLPPKRTTT